MKGVGLVLLRRLAILVLLISVASFLVVLSETRGQPSAANGAGLWSPPEISGQSAVVIDGSNGDILYDKESHMHAPPASVTKIATAIVAIENIELDRRVTIDFDSYEMVIDSGSTVMGLKPGDNRSIEDLLYGLMLPSGNDAAVVIARTVAGDEAGFVEMMNEKVRDLGLRDSHFSNPHGLDARNHYSSAYDMAEFSRYGMRYPVFRSLSDTKKYEIKGNRPYDLWNLNRLLYSYDGADGVKIGYTENALETIVASATRDGQKLIVAVMKSNSRYSDARALLDYYFDALKKGQATRVPAATSSPTPTSTVVPTLTAVPVPTSTAVSAPTPIEVSTPVSPVRDIDPLTGILNIIRGLLSSLGF